MNTQQNTIDIQRIKDGAVISDLDGTIYKYLGSKQVIEGHDDSGVNEYSTPDKVKDLVGLFMLVVLGYSLTVILFL